MAVTATRTVRQIVTQALRKSGILAFGETAAAEDADAAKDELDAMLKSWQAMGYNLWTKTSGSHTMTATAAQTLTPVRPLSILSCRFKESSSATELVMTRMTRDEYDSLPDKTTTGTPTMFYYDRQREAARLYVWPILSSVTAQTLEYTYDRELEDIASLNDIIDVPGEWWDAVVYNLAARIQESIPMVGQSPLVAQRAAQLLRQAAAFDQEESVFFAGEYSI